MKSILHSLHSVSKRNKDSFANIRASFLPTAYGIPDGSMSDDCVPLLAVVIVHADGV